MSAIDAAIDAAIVRGRADQKAALDAIAQYAANRLICDLRLSELVALQNCFRNLRAETIVALGLGDLARVWPGLRSADDPRGPITP